jgi:D-alanyl-D-alanine carboxypeptidase
MTSKKPVGLKLLLIEVGMRIVFAIGCSLFFLSACNGQSESLPPQTIKEAGPEKNEGKSSIVGQAEPNVENKIAHTPSTSGTEQVHTNTLLGKNNPSTNPDFIEIPQEMANRSGMRLHRSAFASFKRMRAQAKEDGVVLTIISATRTFEQQKRIWERKWTGAKKVDGMDLSVSISDPRERAKKILEYSSMPGTSRHHWGTDIDINSLNNDYFSSGKGKKEYEWLRDNGHEFGFCQPYSPKGEERTNGYEMEKWHWSYMPLAEDYLMWYVKKIKPENLNGFKGSDALPFDEVLNYVTGISQDCK